MNGRDPSVDFANGVMGLLAWGMGVLVGIAFTLLILFGWEFGRIYWQRVIKEWGTQTAAILVAAAIGVTLCFGLAIYLANQASFYIGSWGLLAFVIVVEGADYVASKDEDHLDDGSDGGLTLGTGE